ncbi:hypothetical protein [Carboxylicivirga taeanensis]
MIVVSQIIFAASHNEIALDEQVLPVGRSYKTAVNESVLQPINVQVGTN